MSTKPTDFQMEYRLLGETGLKVSVLGMGAMTYDTVDKTIELMKCVRKYGVNFFDNAEAYGNPVRGAAETNFGKALKILQRQDPQLWRRSDLVLTTKLFWGPQKGDIPQSPVRSAFGVNELGLTRKHLFEGMRDSLDRMQLSYVDLVYAHRPDPLTSIEQIVRTFNSLIRAGYAFHWGTSMWKPTQIVEAFYIARNLGLEPPVMEQPIYSMFDREVMEHAYLDLFKAPYHLGTTIWNVLDRGILSGKYNKGIPKDGRLSGNNALGAFVGHAKHVTREKVQKVDKLMAVAREMGVSVAELAIGWAIKNGNCTVCILGGTKVWQLEQSMGAIKVANMIDAGCLKRIEAILQNKPQPGILDRVWRTNKQVIAKL